MSNKHTSSTATSTDTPSTTTIHGKAKNIDRAIKKHVRAIQRRLRKLAKLDKKQESKLEAIKEPVTFCERAVVEEHFAKKADKQRKKIVKHTAKADKLCGKLKAAGVMSTDSTILLDREVSRLAGTAVRTTRA